MRPPYSPAISKNGFIFLSGQIHLKEEGQLLEGSVEEQTHLIMGRLQKILESKGATFNDVVKTTIYTTDMSLYSQVNEVYVTYFSGELPAREMVEVKGLPLGARLEISMIAASGL